MEKNLARDRVAKGLCPQCGEEAAPYYLCPKHRDLVYLRRILNRGASVGGFTRTKEGRHVLYGVGDSEALDAIKWRPDPKESDKRRGPRLGRVPVDVEREVIEIVRAIGRPVTMDEILAAWGALRQERSGSIAGNMARIIEGRRQQAEKAARRMARWAANGAFGSDETVGSGDRSLPGIRRDEEMTHG